MPSSKPRRTIYFDEENFERLLVMSRRPGMNCSTIVNQAMAAFFMNEHEVKRDAALIRRLDKMMRQSLRLKRNQIITLEAFTLFVRYFLTVIPPVPDSDKKAAQAQGASRFERYLQSLKIVLADGESVLFTALEDIKVDESAFFTKEELMRLHQPARTREAVDA